jgi:translation initiation factor 1
MPQSNHKTVWSSEGGDLRKHDDKSIVGMTPPIQDQVIYLHRESKGRGGKTVTLIKGLKLSEEDLSALTKKIKVACGSGGTVKSDVIEIQGEHREKIADTLRKMGYRVKVAGG